MIEKVYSGKEPEGQGNVRIPKNIKQIGSNNSNKKIYVEDYVMNILKRAPEKENDIKYGVLLGSVQNSGGNSYIFIKGLIEVRDIIENSIIFNDDIWSTVYQDKKQFFEKLDIVGWYVSVPYRVSDDMNGIRKLHLDNFAGNNKVCFLSDRTENEEGFYLYEQTSFNKQKGYYIYYEKNEKMKRYVKNRDNNAAKANNVPVVSKEKQQVKSVKEESTSESKNLRQTLKDVGEENKRQGRLAYSINGILIVALLLSTVVMLNNYGELKNIKQTLSNYSLSQEAKAVNEILDAYSGNEVSTAERETTITVTTIEQTTKEDADMTTEEIQTEEQQTNKPSDVASSFSGTYHTVEKGQTLYDISVKYYGSSKMVEQIKELNEIDDDYKIIEGEKILLP